MATYSIDEAVQASSAVLTTINKDGESQLDFFKYTKLFYNHFKNQLCHQPIAVEDSWAAMRWSNRVFTFLIIFMDVNMMIEMEQFRRKEKVPMLTSRLLIAESPIVYQNIEQEQNGRTIMKLYLVLVCLTLMTGDQFCCWNGYFDQKRNICNKGAVDLKRDLGHIVPTVLAKGAARAAIVIISWTCRTPFTIATRSCFSLKKRHFLQRVFICFFYIAIYSVTY
jgi:hypothetical protein